MSNSWLFFGVNILAFLASLSAVCYGLYSASQRKHPHIKQATFMWETPKMVTDSTIDSQAVFKENSLQDLKKAQFYLNRKILLMEKEEKK
jgi:hypothetical protein